MLISGGHCYQLWPKQPTEKKAPRFTTYHYVSNSQTLKKSGGSARRQAQDYCKRLCLLYAVKVYTGVDVT